MKHSEDIKMFSLHGSKVSHGEGYKQNYLHYLHFYFNSKQLNVFDFVSKPINGSIDDYFLIN